MKKKWEKPLFYLIDRDSVKNGNHNGFNENTIKSVVFTTDGGNTTFYFQTGANAIHTLVNNGNPNNYFS